MIHKIKNREPGLSPNMVNARFLMWLRPHRGPRDELAVAVSRSHQKSENHGKDGQDLAPLIDLIESLSDELLLSERAVVDMQHVVFLDRDDFPPDEQNDHGGHGYGPERDERT